MTPLLSLVMITKNEASNIVAVLNSARDAIDRVTILDTSTDGTPDLARQWMRENDIPGDVVSEGFVDYATTRNRSLDLAEPTSQFSLLLSGDEYLNDGKALREFLRTRPLSGGYNTRLDWDGHDLDSVRVIRNVDRWRYVGVIHECFPTHAQLRIPGVVIAHRGGDPLRKAERRYSDLRLLHKEYEKNPNDARTVFYLASTLRELNFRDEAIATYKKRITLGGFDEEIYMSMYRIGLLSPWPDAQQWFVSALSHSPHRAEPLYEIAMHHFQAKNYALAYSIASRGAGVPYPEKAALFIQRDVYRFQLHDLVAVAASNLGAEEKKVGVRSAEIVVAECPGNERAAANLKLYREWGFGRDPLETLRPSSQDHASDSAGRR